MTNKVKKQKKIYSNQKITFQLQKEKIQKLRSIKKKQKNFYVLNQIRLWSRLLKKHDCFFFTEYLNKFLTVFMKSGKRYKINKYYYFWILFAKQNNIDFFTLFYYFFMLFKTPYVLGLYTYYLNKIPQVQAKMIPIDFYRHYLMSFTILKKNLKKRGRKNNIIFFQNSLFYHLISIILNKKNSQIINNFNQQTNLAFQALRNNYFLYITFYKSYEIQKYNKKYTKKIQKNDKRKLPEYMYITNKILE